MLEKLERRAPRLARVLKEIEIQFKWLLIWLFFLSFQRRTYRRKHHFDPKLVRRVLVLRHDKIGDMVVTLPTFHTLKHYFPTIEIGVMASPTNAILTRNDKSVSFTHVYRKRLKGTLAMYKEVRAMNYDVVIDLLTGPSVTSVILAMATSPGAYRIGAGKVGMFKYYDYYSFETVNRARQLHVEEIFRSMLIPFGIPLTKGILDRGIQLHPTEKDRGKEIFGRLRDSRFRRIVLLNGSAGRLGRTLAAEQIETLVSHLSHRYPELQFIMSYPPGNINFAKDAVANAGPNVTLLPEGMSIIDVIAIMPYFDLVISVDTSIGHIAASLDVPVLAMYTGNQVNFMRWRPLARRLWVVRSPHEERLEEIDINKVKAMAEKVLVELFQLAPQPGTT